MKKITGFIGFLILVFSISAFGQTTIAVQDFEAVPATPTWGITAGSGNISTATGSGDTPASQRIRGGAQSWQVNNGTATLDLAAVNTTGYGSIRVTVHISSTSTTTGNGAETADTLTVAANLNGSGFPATPDITVTGNLNSRWGYNDTVNDSTPAGTPITVVGANGTNQGTIHSTLEITIPNGTTSVALRISALNNSAGEVWNVDDVSITGLQPLAAEGVISGRVTDLNGNGLAKVRLTLSGGELSQPIVVRTNAFGYYTLPEVEVGATYTLTASDKRYTFANPSRVINLQENVSDADFVSEN